MDIRKKLSVMKLSVRGKAYNIKDPIIGIITLDNSGESNRILLTNEISGQDKFKAIISTSNLSQKKTKQKLVYNLRYDDHLCEGDIVAITSDGNIKTMYRKNANANFLLVTERCNSNCLMCSQPPKNKDDTSFLYKINSKTISLLPKDLKEIGITGGEPTLLGDNFFNMISQIKQDLPNTEVHILTNGRSFAWESLAKRLSEIDNKRVMLGIPLYSDFKVYHDYIVQANDAFDQTILGLYNLAKHKQRIEIRIVLHKLSIDRLDKLSEFIYRNLPFVEQVCFMGLEYTGYTPYNKEKLWIDPIEYMPILYKSVKYLDDHNIKVKIYNLQLCILDKKLWRFSKKSISDWKNIYFKDCNNCDELKNCGGLFSSHAKKVSNHIKAIKYEQS